jgi:hypothetical protein
MARALPGFVARRQTEFSALAERQAPVSSAVIRFLHWIK